MMSLMMSLTFSLAAGAAAGMPEPLACQAKLLAYDFASHIQPERAGGGGLAAVALGLGISPANRTCVTASGGGGGHHPRPGPPPPPKPVVPAGSCSALMDGMSLVYGDSTPVSAHAKTTTAAACLALCKAQHNCTYGTWHDAHQGKYASMCLLRSDGRYLPHRQGGHTSFLCNTTGANSRIPGAATPTTWTILQHDGPNHLGLWCNALPRASNGPNHLGFGALQTLSPARSGGRTRPAGSPSRRRGLSFCCTPLYRL